MAQSEIEVAIIGAGPYGLSLASYLSYRGINRRIFGHPMQAWRQMPPGMNLKSFGFATNIPTPQPHYTLPEYCRSRKLEDFEPILFSTFVEYGEWFKERLVPDVEQVHVTAVTKVDNGFELTLETGEQLRARRVIVAAGLGHFTRIPEVLAALPRNFVTHASDTAEFLKTTYAGSDVTVVGAGQSALEAAALLHEGGAKVRIVARREVWWSSPFSERTLRDKLMSPNTVTGPGRINWVLQHLPMLPYYVLSTERRVRFTRNFLGPLGAWWLRDRVEGKFPILSRTAIVAASTNNGAVRLKLRPANGEEHEIQTDHVISATGYEADIDRLPFLTPQLAREIRRIERAPELSPNFESSVPGLYFVGPVASFSFGPLVRFVAGATFTVPRVIKHVVRGVKRERALSGRFEQARWQQNVSAQKP